MGESQRAEALEVAQRERPDLVLMDIRMPGVDGVRGTKLIREQLPETKVLILTTFNDSDLIFDALDEGASGYLLKDIPTKNHVSNIISKLNLRDRTQAAIFAVRQGITKFEA